MVPVPDGVPLEHASFTTLGSIALHAVRTANIGLGETVAVIGLGIVGQLVAQLARLQGGTVVGIDLKPERIALVRELGAEFAIAPTGGGGDSLAHQWPGSGLRDRCRRSKIRRALSSGARDLRRPRASGDCRRGPIDFPWHEMYMKEIKLFMSRAYGPGSYDPAYEKRGQDYPVSYVRWTENRNMEEFLRLVAAGRVSLAPLVTHRFTARGCGEAYQTILEPAAKSLAVILQYPSCGRCRARTVRSAAPR